MSGGAGVAPHHLSKEPVMAFEVPDACTLPTAGQPVRPARFDELFTTAVREVDLVTATHARKRHTPATRTAA